MSRFIFNEASSFFRNLQQVDLMLEREAVRSVMRNIRHASKVKLQIRSRRFATKAMFSNLKYLVNCQDLTLMFEGEDTDLDGEDLCNLNTLQRLESLVLMPAKPGKKPANLVHFDDASDFEAIFAGVPRLHSLNWQLSGMDLSVQTLTRLSRSPRFRNICFRGSWDLLGLAKVDGWLFPNLRNLTLQRTVVRGHKGNIPYRRIAENLLQHAPRLEKLRFKHDRNAKVHDTWKKLERQRTASSRSQIFSNDDISSEELDGFF